MRRIIGAGLTLIFFLLLLSRTVVPKELLPIIKGAEVASRS